MLCGARPSLARADFFLSFALKSLCGGVPSSRPSLVLFSFFLSRKTEKSKRLRFGGSDLITRMPRSDPPHRKPCQQFTLRYVRNHVRRRGSFGHQSEITREQLSLPLASPPSPSGIRGILWVVQSIDLWLVSRGHLMTPMKYSDRHLAGLSARPPDRVELIGAGSLGYGNGPASAEG